MPKHHCCRCCPEFPDTRSGSQLPRLRLTGATPPSTMNPHISVPRQHAGPANLGGSTPTSRRSSVRMPRFFKRSVDKCSGWNYMVTDPRNRLFKFPQMDFEMAIWEMTSLLIAPKKVFKSIYYHVSALRSLG